MPPFFQRTPLHPFCSQAKPLLHRVRSRHRLSGTSEHRFPIQRSVNPDDVSVGGFEDDDSRAAGETPVRQKKQFNFTFNGHHSNKNDGCMEGKGSVSNIKDDNIMIIIIIDDNRHWWSQVVTHN